jgi:hypothetical protein
MQSPALVEYVEMRARSLSIKADTHDCFADVQVPKDNFRKPIRQLRIEQQ